VQYNRSGQHDDDKDEWLSEKENKRWARAAAWKTPGSNNVIRHQQAMIYSIALMDQCDFESIGEGCRKVLVSMHLSMMDQRYRSM